MKEVSSECRCCPVTAPIYIHAQPPLPMVGGPAQEMAVSSIHENDDPKQGRK